MRFYLLILLFLHLPLAQAFESLSYSGRLVNSNGAPVPGPVDLTFDLAYSNAPSTVLCSQDRNGVNLSNGVFHVTLDFSGCSPSLTSILSNTPSPHTVGIRVIDRTPTPDKIYSFQAIHSMPFSLMSQMSKTLAQMNAAEGQILTWNDTSKQWEPRNPVSTGNGTVTLISTGPGLTGGPINGAGTISIVNDGVDSTMIKDATIVDADISATADIAQSKIKNLTTDLAAKESLIGTGSSTDYLNGVKAWNNFDQSVRNALLIGYTSGAATPVAATDNVMEAIGKLEGQIIANDTAFDNSGQWDKDGTLLFYNSGNVGIGTATPSDKLEVVGDVSVSNKLRFKNSAISYVELKAPVGASAVTLTLPGALGTNGQVLSTDSSGNLSWLTPSTDSSQITDGSIVDADISSSANIAQSKISGLVTALSGKEPTLDSGVAGQYLAGGKVWAILNTDVVPEGITRLYFTEDKVLATDLLGLSTTAGSVTAADSILSAIGKTVGNVTTLTTAQADFLKKDGSVTMTGNLDVGGKAIINLLDPVVAQDAATKAYVDAEITSAVVSPAGNNKAIQFNNAGAFSANDNLVWDNTNRRLGIDGSGLATAPLSPLHVHVNANEAIRVSHNGGYHWGLIPSGSTLSIKDLTNNLNRLTIGNTFGNFVEMNGTLKLTGATSGFTGIASPAVGSNITYTLPAADGTGGYVLSTNGSGALSWVAQPITLAPSGNAGGDLSGTYPNPTITGLAATKVSDGSIDNIEFGYLDGVSSNLQMQLNAKEATIAPGTIDQYWAGTKAWRDFDSDVRTALLSAYSVTAGVVTSGDGIQAAISKLDGNIASLQANGQWTKNLTDIYYNLGNVGIGTTSPGYKLDVGGTIRATAGVRLEDNGRTAELTAENNQMAKARASAYAAIAAKNPGVDFSVYMVPWDGLTTLENNCNSDINTGWHAQVAVKGNYYDQAFDGSEFNYYSSIVNSQAQFDAFKSTGTQWWIGCSTLGAYSRKSVEGNGTTNYISKWTGANTTGNSIIFDNGTNVGIGTSNPSKKLEVLGTGSFTDKLWASYGNTNVNGYSWVDAAFTTNSIEIVNNNAGETTSSPTLAFHRYGTGGPQFRLDASGTNVLYLESSNPNSARNPAAYGGGTNNYFSRLHIDGALSTVGNVGIGTITPKNKIHIHADTGTPGIVFTNSANVVNQKGFRITNDNSRLNFQKTDDVGNFETNLVNILPNGYMGIGVVAPTAKLHIHNTDATPNILLSAGSRDIATPTGETIQFGHWDGSTFTERMNIGPTGTLKVNGTIAAGNSYNDCPVGWGCNGQFWDISTSGLYYSVLQARSDKRLKKNIEKVSDDAILKLLGLNPVIYEWKDPKIKGKKYGFIAQEVENVMPDLVATGSDKRKTKSVDYMQLISPLVKGFQYVYPLINEHDEKIKEFDRTIASQKAEIEKLKLENNYKQQQLDEMKQAICEINPKARICQ